MFNTVQKRVLAILLLLIIIITMFASFSRYYNNKNYSDFVQRRNFEKKQSFEKIVQLYNNKLEVFTRDYSVWDDMVKFTETRDSLWVQENVDNFLEEFSADCYWFLDNEFNLIHSNNKLESKKIKMFPLNRDAIKNIFNKPGLCSFYIQTDEGIFNISGASIHKTSDTERKDKPAGYFFVGDKISESVMKELSLISDTKIELLTGLEEGKEEYDPNFILFPLKDWKDSNAAYFKMSLENKVSDSKLYRIIYEETAFYIMLAVGSLLMVSLLMYFWVNRPLSALSDSLKSNNPETLKNLLTDKTEFGDLARLVEQSFSDREKKDILLKEIHHRVKNNLQVISSLIGLQSRNIKDPELLKSFNITRDRVKSIALIHEKLYQADDLARIGFSEYISSIADHLVFSYAADRDELKVKITAENIFLNIDIALPCGLIINELVSNSLKYAFPENSAGTITVSFNKKGNEYCLHVKDSGIGIPQEKLQNNTISLGLRLIKTLAQQLRGTLDISTENGTSVLIKFPETTE